MKDLDKAVRRVLKTAKASTFCEEAGRFTLLGCNCCLDKIIGDGCPCCDVENNSILWCEDYPESRWIADTFKSFDDCIAVELWDEKLQKHCLLVNISISDEFFKN